MMDSEKSVSETLRKIDLKKLRTHVEQELWLSDPALAERVAKKDLWLIVGFAVGAMEEMGWEKFEVEA